MLLDETKRAVDALGLNGRSVLVAASGGLDSNALVHALLEIAGRNLLKLSIGHVNHGLRAEESEADQQAVLQLADGLGLPAFSRRVDPEQLRVGRSSRERPTLQEAARTLRYRALREMAVEGRGGRTRVFPPSVSSSPAKRGVQCLRGLHKSQMPSAFLLPA